MPIHDLQCKNDDCDYTYSNLYIPLHEIEEGWWLDCPDCGDYLEFDLRCKTSRNTRSHKFQEFTAEHTGRLTGRKEKITSLADIRRIEREHQDENVCFEAFSYDNENRVPDPVAKDKPVRMTDAQKREFSERYAALNDKSERTARDY